MSMTSRSSSSVGWGKPILAGKIDLSKSRTKSTPRLFEKDGESFARAYKQSPKSYTMRKESKDTYLSAQKKSFVGDGTAGGKKKLVPYDPNASRNIGSPHFSHEPKKGASIDKSRNTSSIVFDDGSAAMGFKPFAKKKAGGRLPPNSKNPGIVAEYSKWIKRQSQQ